MCRVLKVSRSGYYDWQQRVDEPTGRAAADQVLLEEIKRVHAKFGYYGSPRMHRELLAREQVVAQVLGEGLEGFDDHPGLGHVHVTGTQRIGGLHPPGVERRGERRVATYGPVRILGLVRQPGRGGPVTRLLGDVVGDGEDPKLLRDQPCLRPRHADQELPPLARGAERRADRGQLVQHTVEPIERLGVGAGHETSQASTTDSRDRESPVSTEDSRLASERGREHEGPSGRRGRRSLAPGRELPGLARRGRRGRCGGAQRGGHLAWVRRP